MTLVAACAVGSLAMAQPVDDAWRRETLATADGARSYRLYVPPSIDGRGERPLIVLLHGRGGRSDEIVERTAAAALARREGIVVAAPDSLGDSWNYVRGIPGYPVGPDDDAFMARLVEEVAAAAPIDVRRVYAVGYSSGGFMAQRLVCTAPATFAGAVSVAAGGFAGLNAMCEGAPPTSVGLVHGTADANVPWAGASAAVPGGSVYITWPLPDTLAFWAEHSRCRPDVARTEGPGNRAFGVTHTVVLALEGCAAGHRVALVAAVGGGHTWPATGGDAFDATATAWRFLDSERLP